MALSLRQFVDDFASALRSADHSAIAHKNFQPGIGPFGEANTVREALNSLQQTNPLVYGKAVTKRHPDLLIPNEWQIEFKVVRPFGDNGKEAESWSQNVLHPYAGHISSLGDCLRLLESGLSERRGIVVYGFEHNPPKSELDPCISGFELLARSVLGIRISDRVEVRVGDLIHPVHQVLRVFAWEVI